MFSAFRIVRQLHEMTWYLLEAQERTYDPATAREARDLADSIASVTHADVDELLSIDAEGMHASVRELLMDVSAEVRGSYFADAGRPDRASTRRGPCGNGPARTQIVRRRPPGVPF